MHTLTHVTHTHTLTQITSAYITSRLEAMESVVRDSLENPLDDNTIVTQQLDQMATIGRSHPHTLTPSHILTAGVSTARPVSC